MLTGLKVVGNKSHGLTTINPATGEPLQTYPAFSDAQIEQAVAQGHATALAWGREPLATRVQAVRNLAAALRAQKADFARLMTQEMGKPLAEAAGEMEKSAVTALYYADEAQRLLGDEPVAIDGVDAWVSYEPMDLVLAVMPWNFPVWQVMRFAIPSLVAGNGVLLKHSPNVTGSALAIQQLVLDAGCLESKCAKKIELRQYRNIHERKNLVPRNITISANLIDRFFVNSPLRAIKKIKNIRRSRESHSFFIDTLHGIFGYKITDIRRKKKK